MFAFAKPARYFACPGSFDPTFHRVFRRLFDFWYLFNE
jgi:hypothetical protein